MAAAVTEARTGQYASFRILIDDPAAKPALGFEEYAEAFEEIVCASPPRFAVGIFGGWGSGKTTLMRAIESRIKVREDVIPVWFNAWRYEREEQLIIPLLDVLREALVKWATDEGEDLAPDTLANRARRAAAAMGAAARAVASGVSLSARLPGGFAEATVSLKEMLSDSGAMKQVEQPASTYHAAFTAMADAVEGFVKDGETPPPGAKLEARRRIVVFIDDLDRCLPLNALSVLEAMKLFFDLDGFVFVVGLDQDVIERAIELHYKDRPENEKVGEAPEANGNATASAESRSTRAPITGRDYIKKIFQVPFALPPVDREQLEELVEALARAYSLSPVQEGDLRTRVLRHLEFFTDQRGINAREVKRLINAYTLQAKLLSAKLGEAAHADTILALQVMAFRPDWQRIYQRLLSDPDTFPSRLERVKGTVWIDGQPLPPRLVDYLEGAGSSLLTNEKLAAYVSSSEASHTTEPYVSEALVVVDDLLRFVGDQNAGTEPSKLSTRLSEKLDALVRSLSEARSASTLLPQVADLQTDVLGLDPASETPFAEWSDGFKARLERLANDLREIRAGHSLSGA